MTANGPSSVEWTRVRALQADIVNFAYQERYEASEQATHELLAFAAQLQRKYGPLPAVFAIRATYADSVAEREHLLHATYRQAEFAGDTRHQTWAAVSLASHYVDAVPNVTEAERWVSVAEERSRSCDDALVADDIDRLRGIVNARRRRLDPGSRGRMKP